MADKNPPGSFGVSAYLNWLHSPAPSDEVRGEVAKVLAILGEGDPALTEELTQEPVTRGVLVTLKDRAAWLAPNQQRDRISRAAALYWAAQLLTSTVMRSSVLNISATYSSGAKRAIRRGADGLFEFGESQFEELGALALDIVDWLIERKPGSVGLIESPIGNTLPVQVLQDAAQKRGLSCSIVQWNAPRNVQRDKGRTVKDAARDWAAAVRDFDLVIFLDEIVSGSRYRKLLRALQAQIAVEKLLPIGMLFHDSYREDLMTNPIRASVTTELPTIGKKLGFPNPVREFPRLRLFKFDGVKTNAWGGPVVWGDSEIAAGKRKLNLIFTLLHHCLRILEDLGKPGSKFARYLIRAWSLNTRGEAFGFEPSVAQTVFKDIVTDLHFRSFRGLLWDQAKRRFPNDYTGTMEALNRRDASERWMWLQDTFLFEAHKRIGERAGLAWQAIDAAFPASFADISPEPPRDFDATPFTLPFNAAISSFNQRLRERIADAGTRRRELVNAGGNIRHRP